MTSILSPTTFIPLSAAILLLTWRSTSAGVEECKDLQNVHEQNTNTATSILRHFRSSSRMAWRCSASNNDRLVDNLCASGVIKHPDVENAMRATDRGHYVPKHSLPYQSIGYKSTISAPHMHAYALESMRENLSTGARVLDIGCGSGVLVEAFSHMVGPNGVVVGVEHIPELAEMSKQNLLKNPEMARRMETGNIHIYPTDGFLGCDKLGPYDAIHVGAAAPDIPDHLVNQLNAGGILVLPIGQEYGSQEFVKITKDDHGNLHKKHLLDVRYVPLTSKDHQLGNDF
eukprot:gene2837-5675_t